MALHSDAEESAPHPQSSTQNTNPPNINNAAPTLPPSAVSQSHTACFGWGRCGQLGVGSVTNFSAPKELNSRSILKRPLISAVCGSRCNQIFAEFFFSKKSRENFPETISDIVLSVLQTNSCLQVFIESFV
jgi:hypothetical protein